MKNTLTRLLCIALLLLGVGCSKLTKENYDKITMGMNYDEVIAILGEADECGGAVGVQNCSWGGEEKYIKINFVGKKVVLYSAKGL
ncbi:MAG: DUF3862 domain-containing protein [Desulfosarcinaceae bacterium]|nr:DUF3862 domain-containing protein [Desulfosarcinaceae bacterium]